MPRLLPKLIQSVKTLQKGGKLKAPETHSHRTGSRRRSAPVALPYPSFSPYGRKQSILLDDFNPVMHHDAYTQHKHNPPVIPSLVGRGKCAKTQVREMTDRECEWWSNPYLRMLASPLRVCIVTGKQLPADFMIRLAALEVSGSRLSRTTGIAALLPDGVEHPRFRRHNSGRGYYIVCRKDSIAEMMSRSSHKRILFAPSNIHVHSLLATQISHQLRIRVLQELELLAESLRCAPQGSRENTVLRRLTRTEWAEIKTAGRISQPGAVAVLVVPPPRTALDDNPESSSYVLPPLPPLSILHETQVADLTYTGAQSERRVPLYNGLSLFPSRSSRSNLYKALQKTLQVERRARWRQKTSSSRPNSIPEDFADDPCRQREKPSHAYLLRSNGNTIRRADSAPLAISLWKIRMWEGQGWEAGSGSYGGWAVVKQSCSNEQSAMK